MTSKRCSVCGDRDCRNHKREPYTRLRRNASPAEVAQALTDLRRLFTVTPLMKAQSRFERAKAEYDSAARALLAQELGAAQRADAALSELNEARADLQRLGEVE